MKTIRNLLLIIILPLFFTNLQAQTQKAQIYNPQANAQKQIAEAVKKAKQEGKHVFLQIGGNWCSWCVMMHKFYTKNTKIDSMMRANYVVEMINYSKENKNLDVLASLDFPQRFGFPVIVILDENGKRIHTQNTLYLEKGRGYSEERFMEFLYNWSPAALNPDNYKK